MTTVGRRSRKPQSSARKIKLAITLPHEQVAAAKRAVREGRASSVSAYVARALKQQAETDALGRLIMEMRVEDGAPTAEDYAWADAALGLDASRPKGRKRPS